MIDMLKRHAIQVLRAAGTANATSPDSPTSGSEASVGSKLSPTSLTLMMRANVPAVGLGGPR